MAKHYTAMVSEKSKKVTLVLCLVFGFMGAHYFYVGRPGRGFLYMCTAGGFVLGWLKDMVVVATGNFRDAYGLKVKG